MKTCFTCKFPKSLDEFGNNKNNPGGKQNYCKECSRKKDKMHYQGSKKRRQKIRERNKDSRRRHHQIMIDYLSQHPCVDCGESDIMCLDFDHVKGSKSHNVSQMLYWDEKAIMKEIAKCVVRCANCHRKKTCRERGWFKSLMKTAPEGLVSGAA